MSFELFVVLILVLVWASLPLSLVISTRDYGDELADSEHDHSH